MENIVGCFNPFIKPEPITVKGIKTFKPSFFYIYTDKKGNTHKFIAVEEKKGGTALGAIFKKATQLKTDKKWMGKVGNPRGILKNDPNTIRTRTKKELNIDTIREKLAYDLFQELGTGIFLTPKTRLSLQPIRDEFNKTNILANAWVEDGITESLRIMSSYLKGYNDFAEAITLDGNEKISFMQFLIKYHRPPSSILTKTGDLVPLNGVMGLLAVGRCLADVDLLGGSGCNAGFLWVENGSKIVEARAVKIDPGYAFCFTHEDPKNASENFVINTERKLGSVRYHLNDLKDLQTSTGNHDATIFWTALTNEQRDEFLSVFLNSARYLRSEAVLDLLVYREGKFDYPGAAYSNIAYMPKDLAQQMQQEMKTWIDWQLKIYATPLGEFESKYPEQILRIQYIDRFGEIALPMSKETFPIRELFTDLVLLKAEKDVGNAAALPNQMDFTFPEENSLSEAWRSSENPKTLVRLDSLFEGNTKKILIIGRAGAGKSTLCQKIAHDWASGRLFNVFFDAVYWIPLRNLNNIPYKEDSLNDFFSKAVASCLLNNPHLSPSILRQIQNKRDRVLFIFDGFDEAKPEIQERIQLLFNDTDLHLILSSRPGPFNFPIKKTNLIIENIGFSKEHIKAYSHYFFSRKRPNKSSDLFFKTLRKDLNLFHLAHTPLHLQMLCNIWEKGSNKTKIASTLTNLYETMISEMLEWQSSYLNKNLQKEVKSLFFSLGSLAAVGLENDQLIIQEADITKMLENTPYTVQNFLDTGLVKSTQGTNKEFYFVHLTFQEYLAAHYFSELPSKDRYSFIQKFQKNPRFHLMIIFLCGIIYKNHPQNINQFFDNLEISEDNIELTFRCLNECENYMGNIYAIEKFFSKKPEIINSKLTIREKRSLHRAEKELPFFIYLSAIDQNHALRWLLHKKPELLLHTDKDGRTIFIRAAYNGNIELMEFLYNQPQGYRLTQKFLHTGSTPLIAAAINGHIEVMAWLLEKDPTLLNKTWNEGTTVFYTACEGGHLDIMQWLYDKDPSFINKFSKSGATPLHAAAIGGHIDAMQWLCDKDPSLLSKSCKSGATPLHFGAIRGHIDALQWLYNKDPSLLSKFCKNPGDYLHTTVQFGFIKVVEWFLAKDASLIDVRADSDQTKQVSLFATAAGHGKVAIMEMFFAKKKSMINELTSKKLSALHIAAQFGHIEVMEWLFNHSPALLSIFGKDGWTPFHSAARLGQVEAMKWLYIKNADFINAFENDGYTPLHCAANSNSIKALEWLVEKEPSLLTKVRANGATPLHVAAEQGCFEATKWLAQKDPSLLKARMNNGWTPYDIAKHNNQTKIAEILST